MVIVRWVHFSVPASLIIIQWEELGPGATIQVNQLSNVIDLVMKSDFKFSSYWWISPSILQLKYLFIDTYKDPPIAGLRYLLEYDMIVLFMKTQFLIWIRDNKPARKLNLDLRDQKWLC